MGQQQATWPQHGANPGQHIAPMRTARRFSRTVSFERNATTGAMQARFVARAAGSKFATLSLQRCAVAAGVG
jgi:hypothetical protein